MTSIYIYMHIDVYMLHMPIYTAKKMIVAFEPVEKHEKLDFDTYKLPMLCKHLRDRGQYKRL